MLTLSELIDAAADESGSRSALARDMNTRPQRINEWARGAAKPDAHDIAFLARKAGLPVLETVAEIEAQLDERYASIWREALGKLRAAGIAATVAGVMLTQPSPSEAMTTSQTMVSDATLYIMSTVRRMWRRLMAGRLNLGHI